MSTKKIKSTSINRKVVEQLLKQAEIAFDTELSERYLNDVYRAVDGRVITLPETGRCREYLSLQYFVEMLEKLEAEREQNRITFINSNKWIQKIIEEPGWTLLDRELDSSGYYDAMTTAIHNHEDGRMLLIGWGGATLYLPGKRPPKPGEYYNCLEGATPQGEDFLNAIPSLIQELPKLLGTRLLLDGSFSSLENLDRAVRHKGRYVCLKPKVFPALVAYFGEIIRKETNSRWEIRTTTDFGDPFDEPWIVASNSNCVRPHLALNGELGEVGPFYLKSLATREIKRLVEGFETYPCRNTDFIFTDSTVYYED